MPACEAMIFSGTANNAEVQLSALPPTSGTVRPEAYGRAKITHALALVSTDDVNEVRIVPSGYPDVNGLEVPEIVQYGATKGFDLKHARLPIPIVVDNNANIAVYARSRTAADTTVYVWLLIEYDAIGNFEPMKTTGAEVMRDADAGAALTVNTPLDGTAITTLLAGRKYQFAGITGVGVSGQTAGCVGPVFLKLKGPAEFLGLETWIPLPNSNPYAGNTSSCRFDEAGIKMPVFAAPNVVTPAFLDGTAERPVAKLHFLVDRL